MSNLRGALERVMAVPITQKYEGELVAEVPAVDMLALREAALSAAAAPETRDERLLQLSKEVWGVMGLGRSTQPNIQRIFDVLDAHEWSVAPARDGVREAALNEAAQAICWECKAGGVPEKRIGQTSGKPYWRHYKQGEHYTICPASDIYALAAAKEQADGQV